MGPNDIPDLQLVMIPSSMNSSQHSGSGSIFFDYVTCQFMAPQQRLKRWIVMASMPFAVLQQMD